MGTDEVEGWRMQARCAWEGEPEMFFPLGARNTLRRNSVQARVICGHCPVEAQCLEHALSQPVWQDYGVWGGTTHEDRDRIRRRRGEKLPKTLRGVGSRG